MTKSIEQLVEEMDAAYEAADAKAADVAAAYAAIADALSKSEETKGD